MITSSLKTGQPRPSNMNSLPSPASSPSPPAIDTSSQQQSRKRQRSQSMHSDKSSSSVKRSVSEAPQQDATGQMTNADQMSSLSLADQNKEIDAYMASQDEQTTTLEIQQVQDVIKNMGSSEKLKLVEEQKNQAMQIAQTWFLVSRKWWTRWRKACTGEEDKEGAVSEAELGPVDNTLLLDAHSQLLPGLVEGEEVEFVPEDVWRYFTVWYGQAPHAISRRVISRGDAKEPTLELYPPRFRVSILSLPRMALGFSTPCEWVTVSAGETITQLCIRLADAVKSPQQKYHPYRVWRVDANNDSENLDFPCERLFAAKGTIMEESARTLEEEGLVNEDSFVVEFKQSTPDAWIVDSHGILSHLPTVSLPVFNSKDGFFNKMNNPSSSPKQRATDPLAPLKSPVSKSVSLYNNSNNRSTRTLEPGTLGLGNMGNTCFMNSALQCLAHTKELTDYFLSGVFEDELNADNPLGMGGAIAEAFGALLQRIWATTGTSTSYSPREFKQALQRFAPQFSGYQQHDSQELVAFLLDGLHEDLNRILKKPYVEKPDWEGGGDLELFQLAKNSWDGYLLRNDSVIVDLFQGQYQSTLVCPECEKVSITFDPFMYLTLPIPIQKRWAHSIYYIPWDAAQAHCKVPIEISRDASFKELKMLLGKWMGSNPEHLLTLEVFNHRFYKNLDDNVLVGDMSDRDTIVCFELPCPSQQQRNFKRGTDDPLILPIFLCDSTMDTNNWSSSSYSSRVSHFGYPTILAIKPQDAKSVDAIYGAVVERLVRFTNHTRDLFDWEGTPSYNAELGANGNAIPPEENVEEGDIVDEKTMVVDEERPETGVELGEPKLVGYKKDIFTLRFHSNHREFGTTTYAASISQKWESWELREQKLNEFGSLLCEGDAIYCEFDENMKAYYFGDSRNRYEHARWDQWEDFIHPEYEGLQKAASEKKDKGITLQDCLDEFTKEEMLGDDDLWYCPRCKKHQQATKRFDLWKAPDILVVHLKRFSNSRSLRDKIDAFIDFPIEDLNLDGMIGERAAARRLQDQGIDIEPLNITSLDEPLIYDLFGVDEHIGGLGGGHYRAYASNHATGKWYHFDDSYVRPAQASDAVNADAYLLFYRRRTSQPLGGRLQERIAELKVKNEARREVTPAPSSIEVPIRIDNQLPTPPDDKLSFAPSPQDISDRLSGDTRWALRSGASVTSLTSDEPSTYDDLPIYNDALGDNPVASRFGFSRISDMQSPSSSLGAEGDFTEQEDGGWSGASYGNTSRRLSPGWDDAGSNLASPSYSDPSSETTNDTGHKTYTTAVEDPGNISDTS